MDAEVQARVWQVTVGGRSVKVEALPLVAVDRIAKAADVSWFAVVNTPLADLLVAAELVDAAAAQLGVTAPADLTPRNIVDLFDLVPDDVPPAEDAPAADPFDRSGVQNATDG